MQYYLMHKNIQVAVIELDELANLIAINDVLQEAHLPVGTVDKLGVNKKQLARWWATRSIPASRSGLRQALDQLQMSVSQELLDKCYGLSLSDQYWINPCDHPLEWSEINFFEHTFSDDVGNLLFGKSTDSKNVSLISPDNTSDGQLLKKWKIQDGKRLLLKGSSAPYYQEAFNEVIASKIADALHIPHVEYAICYEGDHAYSACEDFITSEQDLVSANHLMQAFQKPNHLSNYEFYIACGERVGITDIRQKMEYMLVLDFMIANSDRHFNNFGVVRNAETLEWMGVAPIFDCGTSLWHNIQTSKIKPLALNTPSKPFRETHAEQIKLVQDFSWIDFSALSEIPKYADTLLLEAEDISDSRRHAIVQGIEQRIQLLQHCRKQSRHYKRF